MISSDSTIYKVFIDDIEYTEVSPVNEIIIKQERSDSQPGYVVSYTGDFKLYGQAFDYILERVNENGGCGYAYILITSQAFCGAIEKTYIDGVITLTNVKVDYDKCEAITQIDPNDAFHQFEINYSTEIEVNTLISINGKITGMPVIKRFLHGFENHSTGVPLPETASADFAAGYDVLLLMDRILNVITNGKLRAKSDYFTTIGQNKEVIVTFATTPVLGEVITINYTTEDGSEETLQITSTGIQADFEKLLLSICSQGNEAGYVYNEAVSSGTITTLTMNSRLSNPSTPIVISSGSTVIAISVFQDYVDGAAALYIANGYTLTNRFYNPSDTVSAIPKFEMSFKKLIDILNSIFDVSFAYESSGGQLYLRIEPISYFLNSINTINFDNVVIEQESYTSRIFASVEGGAKPYYFFKNMTCQTAAVWGTPNGIWTNISAINDQIQLNIDREGDLYLIQGQGLDISTPYDQPMIYVHNGAGFNPGSISTTFTNLLTRYYNYAFCDTNRLLSIFFHIPFTPDALNLDSVHETSTLDASTPIVTTSLETNKYIGNEKQYITLMKFKAPLAPGYDATDIGSLTKITFNDGKNINREGIIKILNYNPKTRICDLQVLVK